MKTQRKGSDLRIHIRLAAKSLGREISTKNLTIAELESVLKDLRRQQIEQGIIRGKEPTEADYVAADFAFDADREDRFFGK